MVTIDRAPRQLSIAAVVVSCGELSEIEIFSFFRALSLLSPPPLFSRQEVDWCKLCADPLCDYTFASFIRLGYLDG